MLFSGDLPLTSYLHFMTCREYNRYIDYVFVLVAIFTSCRDIVQQLAHASNVHTPARETRHTIV